MSPSDGAELVHARSCASTAPSMMAGHVLRRGALNRGEFRPGSAGGFGRSARSDLRCVRPGAAPRISRGGRTEVEDALRARGQAARDAIVGAHSERGELWADAGEEGERWKESVRPIARAAPRPSNATLLAYTPSVCRSPGLGYEGFLGGIVLAATWCLLGRRRPIPMHPAQPSRRRSSRAWPKRDLRTCPG
jgi:hypothetical protein